MTLFALDQPDYETTYILKYFWREKSNPLKNTLLFLIILAQKLKQYKYVTKYLKYRAIL